MEEDALHGHIVYSEEVLEFVRLCNEYCMLLEGLTDTAAFEDEGEDPFRQAFITPVLRILSGIYSTLHTLTLPEPVYDEGNEKYVSEQDWSLVFQNVSRLLGPYNAYLRKVDEDEYDRSDLTPHTISEDLSDIYQELRDFTELYSRGIEDIMNDALWEVMENFEEHWGEKLINALSALHRVNIKYVNSGTGGHPGSEQDEGGAYYNPDMFRKFQDQAGEED